MTPGTGTDTGSGSTGTGAASADTDTGTGSDGGTGSADTDTGTGSDGGTGSADTDTGTGNTSPADTGGTGGAAVTEDAATGPVRSGGAARPRGALLRLLALAVLLGGLAAWAALDGARLLAGFGERVDALGAWAPLVFALCYALAVTALLPGAVLSATAGALFGVPVGAATVLVGATLGASLSFGIGRRLGRPAVERYAGTGRLARLDAFLARRGFLAVLVMRLVPLFPFNLVNYGAGVSGVRFLPFVTATALGIVPGTLTLVGLGGALRQPGSPLLWPALGALVVLSVGGGWAARRYGSTGKGGRVKATEKKQR
ncbi:MULTISPECIES: TVP38/TMEM64 family protein [unclassified Streptomyces]|uniref:TVP38/TMEM64 family protein n=1 Tax=unclassified Streptomyces TaxID=2593676 RepID=UPI000AE87D36|nr:MULTISPECIES: TVP38/TMEM64 family protein [unclassified Streptomyces]